LASATVIMGQSLNRDFNDAGGPHPSR